MKNRKFSTSALVIMIILILNLVGGILTTLIFELPSFSSSEIIGIYFGMFVFILLSLFALIGVIRKTRFGLVLTIIIAVLDLLFMVLDRGAYTSLSQDLFSFLLDLALLVLSINILRRI